MLCKLNDLVMVVRSEAGNEGRIGRIVGRAIPGALLPFGGCVYADEDWLVEGRFTICHEYTMSVDGRAVLTFDAAHRQVDLLSYPDSHLRPLRGDGLGDETPADAEKPQPAEA